jgi:hypothetical protein
MTNARNGIISHTSTRDFIVDFICLSNLQGETAEYDLKNSVSMVLLQ